MNLMTDEIRTILREYLELSGTTQKELAEALGKHPIAINKALRGDSGKLPELWTNMFAVTGLKLYLLPADANINALETVRQKAIQVRGTSKRLATQGDSNEEKAKKT